MNLVQLDSHPNVIAHYTSLNTLYSIFNGKDGESISLHLSNIENMNDTEEARIGAKHLRAILEELDCDKARQYLIERFSGDTSCISCQERESSQLKDEIWEKQSGVFLISFTSPDKDKSLESLDHWRAYGDDGCGVCIIFDYEKLKTHTRDRSFISRLGRVHYISKNSSSAEQNDFSEKEKQKLLKRIKENDSSPEYIDGILSYYKNDAFLPENEYRLMVSLGSNISKVDFKESGEQIVSYYNFRIPIDCIKKIILGPACKTRKHIVSQFLKKHNIKLGNPDSVESILVGNTSVKELEHCDSEYLISLDQSEIPYLPRIR